MPGKIKVLTLVSSLAIGGLAGGAERFAVDLTQHLDRERFTPLFCSLWRYDLPSETYWADVLAGSGIEVFFAQTSRPGRRTGALLPALQVIGRRYAGGLDITHSHLPLAGLVALSLRPVLRTKALVRTSHAGHEWGDGLTAWVARQVFTNWVFPLLYDAEACVSQAQVDRFARRPGALLSGRRPFLVYNAIDSSRFADDGSGPARRRELGLAPEDVVVGYVGRLRAEKGVDVLLQAAALVREIIPAARFLIVGSGPEEERLRQQAISLRLNQAVIFAGTRYDVNRLYGAMDLFVLPSFWEGLPTVILESMAAGVPVVATRVSGTCELIRDGQTGWLVPPGDATLLGQAIIATLGDPVERARRAQRAVQEVVPRFTIEQVAQTYEALYQELIG